MNEFAYVVSLVGKRVFNDWSIQYIIKHFDNLDKVRAIIKERHNVEFEQLSSRFTSCYWEFNNITDDRDIRLVVERVDIL